MVLSPQPQATLEEHSYAAKRASLREEMAMEEPKYSDTSLYGSLEIKRMKSKRKSCCICPEWVKDEFIIVFNLAWTMCLATILTNLLAPIGLMFAGHLGIEELGGVALGNTVINIFGNAIGIGLSTACDTFFAQTYGSGNRKRVGVYLQRGTYVILLFAFPCWMVLLNTESILVALGQEPIISKIAADYIMNYMPVIPVIFLFHIFSKYLRNQNIIFPTIFACAAGVAMTTLAAYLMVNVYDLRVRGCAYAQMLGFCVMTGGNVAYAALSPRCKECWDGFTWDALQDWGQFTSLAVYGMFLVLEQIGAFEVGTLLAGLFGQVELGAQTILFQIETITFMIPIGVGIACNIRIGHLLGANDPVQTRRSIYVGYGIIWTVSATVAVLLATLREQIPRLFTNDYDVIQVSANLLLIMALYAVFEGTVGTSAGMMRGCGKQRIAATITGVGYFVIGLPIGIALMFLTDLKTAGFWWGLTIGIVSQSVIYVLSLLCTNWERMASEAQIRAGLAQYLSQTENPGEDNETDDDHEALLGSPRDRSLSTGSRRSTRSDRSDFSGSRRYVGEFTSSLPQIKILKDHNALSKQEMICRRGLVVLLCVLMLVTGFVLRVVFPPAPVEMNLFNMSTPATNSN